MKASEFCKFFDFTYEKEHGYADTEFYSGEYNYKATDDQGVFHDRLVKDVKDFSDEFNSMLQDYIQDDLEEQGFESEVNENYWVSALKWIGDNENYKVTKDVIDCLLHPEHITEE